MATARATVDHILATLDDLPGVSVRAMFGEYALYLDGKVVGLICDDSLFLKDTPGARALLDDPQTGAPYPGAKPHLVADGALDETGALAALLRAVWADVPMPKQKPRKKGKPT